jgi:hypothetical protein
MNGHDPDPRRLSPERRAPRRALAPATAKPPPAVRPPKPHDRHAAITDNLSKWHNYKRWTEKIRSTWDTPDKLDE